MRSGEWWLEVQEIVPVVAAAVTGAPAIIGVSAVIRATSAVVVVIGVAEALHQAREEAPQALSARGFALGRRALLPSPFVAFRKVIRGKQIIEHDSDTSVTDGALEGASRGM